MPQPPLPYIGAVRFEALFLTDTVIIRRWDIGILENSV
jgi:hypothetical protein